MIVHFTFKHPAVAICGRPTKGGPFVPLEGISENLALLVERIAAETRGKGPLEIVCTDCIDAHARRQFCEHGHAWRWDEGFVNGSACQCASLFLEQRVEDGVLVVQTIDEFNESQRLQMTQAARKEPSPTRRTSVSVKSLKSVN